MTQHVHKRSATRFPGTRKYKKHQESEGAYDEDENYHVPPHILLIRATMPFPSVWHSMTTRDQQQVFQALRNVKHIKKAKGPTKKTKNYYHIPPHILLIRVLTIVFSSVWQLHVHNRSPTRNTPKLRTSELMRAHVCLDADRVTEIESSPNIEPKDRTYKV
jgi:hypothetical protein